MHSLEKWDWDIIRTTPAAQALDLKLVNCDDLLRLKVIARLHGRGLPPEINWSDLLQEAFTRVLDGSRPQPEGVSMVAFIAGVMRSIKSEHWRRARKQARRIPKLAAEMDLPEAGSGEAYDLEPGPERKLIAMQALAAINELFAGDVQARSLIAGLAQELSPTEICATSGMSRTEYDSTRRRIRRVLIREGLKWPQL